MKTSANSKIISCSTRNRYTLRNLRPDKRVQYRDAYCSDVSIDSEDEYKINKEDVYSSDSASISDADSIKHIRLAKHRKRNKRVRNANTKRNGKSIKNKETYKRKKVLSQQTPKKGPWISRKIKPPTTSLSPKVKRGNKKKQDRRNSTSNSVSIRDQETTVETLRIKVVEHLRVEKAHYRNFLSYPENLTDDVNDKLYDEYLSDLSQDGHWNIKLADCLPLAVANLYKRQLRIYSSRIANSVDDIVPDLSENISAVEPIKVKLFSIFGQEYYDAVKPIEHEQNTPSCKESTRQSYSKN